MRRAFQRSDAYYTPHVYIAAQRHPRLMFHAFLSTLIDRSGGSPMTHLRVLTKSRLRCSMDQKRQARLHLGYAAVVSERIEVGVSESEIGLATQEWLSFHRDKEFPTLRHQGASGELWIVETEAPRPIWDVASALGLWSVRSRQGNRLHHQTLPRQ